MRNSGVEFDEVNYAKTALDEATVKSLVTKAGSVAAIMNARHATAKQNGWVEQPPDAATFAKAAAAEPNLLRRPIVVSGATIIIGFNKIAYAKLG